MICTSHKIAGVVVLMMVSSPSLTNAACNPNIGLAKPDSRYEDHKDGTVTDLVTGLMWKQCPEGMSTTTSPCDTGTASVFTWQQALLIAGEANVAKAEVAPEMPLYNDWRLPSLKELKSLSEWACYNPAINTHLFPRTPANHFWSSTPVASVGDNAWSVGFFYGGDRWGKKDEARHVRLVRTAK